jgi:hypothetical protein
MKENEKEKRKKKKEKRKRKLLYILIKYHLLLLRNALELSYVSIKIFQLVMVHSN